MSDDEFPQRAPAGPEPAAGSDRAQDSQSTEPVAGGPDKAPAGSLRELAARGGLAGAAGDPAARPAVQAAVYALVWPLVYRQLTCGLELRRGPAHRACARSVRTMAADCADRFEDDVAAVVDYVLRYARQPIHNLEGWISSRLCAAVVDAHRRSRGERGAAQRPRLPRWLASRLAGDPWRTHLALAILTWVGIPATAGTGLWPLDSWAAARAELTGDWSGSDLATTGRDVEAVLSVMRTDPAWYAKCVERPLGFKQAPVYSAGPGAGGGPDAQPPALALVEPHEIEDARLLALAGAALAEIRRGLAGGADPHACIPGVIQTVFAEPDPARELARVPHDGMDSSDRIPALLVDQATLDRIIAVALAITAEEDDG